MKKSFVKILTVALAAATVTGVSVMPAITAGAAWTATSTQAAQTLKKITVSNVTDATKVTAYQLLKGDYDGTMLNGYVPAKAGITISNFEKPTASEITRIANDINDGTITLDSIDMTKVGTSTTYEAQVEAGLYLVLVSGAKAVVYNPAVVAVNVTDPYDLSTAAGTSVNMSTYFKYPANAYMKSSEPNFNKDIVGYSTDASGVGNTEGDFVAHNTDVSFIIKDMKFPSYSQDYKTGLVYTIEDSLAKNSFMGITGLTVKIKNATVTTGFTVTYYTDEAKTVETTNPAEAIAFKVAFDDATIRSNPMEDVEITYGSHFEATAGVNYAENKNTAELHYSNDPKDSSKYQTKTDTTYHYTFGIDADIDAQSQDTTDGNYNKETFELNKVTIADATYEDGLTDPNPNTKKSPYALPGATFTLYTDAAMSNAIRTATSDANGHFQFLGLDTGTYYMQETGEPDGYTLNPKKFQIKIEANMNAEGIMTSYTITTKSNDADGNYTVNEGYAHYTNTINLDTDVAADGSVTNHISDYDAIDPAEVVDTKVAGLPATGGVGTIAITVGAAIGMAGFMTLYIVNKKKRNSEAE